MINLNIITKRNNLFKSLLFSTTTKQRREFSMLNKIIRNTDKISYSHHFGSLKKMGMFSTAQERILNAGKKNLGYNQGQKQSPQYGKSGGFNLLWVFPLITFGLGCWQVQRLQWKLGLIQDISSKIKDKKQEELKLTGSQEDMIGKLKNMDVYERIRLKGEFLHELEMYLGPRGKNDVQSQGGGVFSTSGSVGYNVVTPLKLHCSSGHSGIPSALILVNRGWVPREAKDTPQIQKKRQTNGIVEVDGIIRSGEEKGTFMPDNDPKKNTWYYLDVDEMAKQSGSEPILVELVMDDAAQAEMDFAGKGWPIPRKTNANIRIRNNHLEYAITWFGLSLASALLIKFKKR